MCNTFYRDLEMQNTTDNLTPLNLLSVRLSVHLSVRLSVRPSGKVTPRRGAEFSSLIINIIIIKNIVSLMKMWCLPPVSARRKTKQFLPPLSAGWNIRWCLPGVQQEGRQGVFFDPCQQDGRQGNLQVCLECPRARPFVMLKLEGD